MSHDLSRETRLVSLVASRSSGSATELAATARTLWARAQSSQRRGEEVEARAQLLESALYEHAARGGRMKAAEARKVVRSYARQFDADPGDFAVKLGRRLDVTLPG